MRVLPINIFRKSVQCPASETLLSYRREHMTLSSKANVEAHLAHCEFCNAELQLLKRYRWDPQSIALTQIPAELRKLAEEVLRGTAMKKNSISEVADRPHVSN